MLLAELIAACVEANDLPPAAPDAAGGYEFVFDDGLAVRIAPPAAVDGAGASAVLLSGTVLAELPTDEAAAASLLGRVLRWNFPRLGFQEESLALEPDGAGLMLWHAVDLRGLDAPRFVKHLEAFLNSLEFWLGTVRREASENAAAHYAEAMPALPSRYAMLFP